MTKGFRSDPRIFARVARKNTLSPREEGSQEAIGFLRIFGDFLCVQKVTRRRQITKAMMQKGSPETSGLRTPYFLAYHSYQCSSFL